MRCSLLLFLLIGTQYDKCFLRITSSGDASASLIYNYVSELYSKSWNEAVAKKSLGLNFLVLHELLAPDFLKQLEENKIGRIFTSHPTSDLCDLWKGVDVRDTKVFAQPLRQGLAANPLVTFLDGAANDPCTITKSMIFDYVAVGGSFDQLHNGHRKLLSLAAAVCAKELTIGITGDAMLVNKAHQSLIEPLSDRISHVRGFLSFMKPTLALNVVEINDPFGPAVTDPCLQAILVSSETIVGAFKINHIRREKGMNALHILVIGRADAAILSSSFLREQKSHSL